MSNPRTRGVEFYVKENLVYSTQLNLNRMEEKIFESLFIDVKFKNKTLHLDAFTGLHAIILY